MNKEYSKIIPYLIDTGAVKATKYLSSNLIIRAVRKTYKNRTLDHRTNRKLPRKGENIEITLTIGKPNYIEREFIKKCQKAKEPFPVKKIQLKFLK